MRDIEFVATLASLHDPDYEYPKKDIDDLWELICLCHFHDCLPGSSIEMCYRESDEYYNEVFTRGTQLYEAALKTLGLSTSPSDGKSVTALNTLPWPRAEVVKIPNAAVTSNTLSQSTKDGQYIVLNANSTGLANVHTGSEFKVGTVQVAETKPGVFTLKNDNLEVTVEGGRITSMYDIKRSRHVIPQGKKANQLVIFDDK